MNPFNEKKIDINDSYNIKLWTEKWEEKRCYFIRLDTR